MNGHSHVIYLGNTTEKGTHKEVPNYRKAKQLFIDPKLLTDFFHRDKEQQGYRDLLFRQIQK